MSHDLTAYILRLGSHLLEIARGRADVGVLCEIESQQFTSQMDFETLKQTFTDMVRATWSFDVSPRLINEDFFCSIVAFLRDTPSRRDKGKPGDYEREQRDKTQSADYRHLLLSRLSVHLYEFFEKAFNSDDIGQFLMTGSGEKVGRDGISLRRLAVSETFLDLTVTSLFAAWALQQYTDDDLAGIVKEGFPIFMGDNCATHCTPVKVSDAGICKFFTLPNSIRLATQHLVEMIGWYVYYD